MEENKKLIDIIDNPYPLFAEWFDQAKHNEINDPNAMNLATISEESKISGGCGEGTVLVNGVCQLAEPVDASRPDTFTGMMFVLIVVGILVPIWLFVMNRVGIEDDEN